MALSIGECGQFAKGHAMAKRDVIAADKGFQILLHERSFDMGSGDGIRAIENPERLARLGRFLQRVEQSAGVGVKPRADILYVVDNCVEILDLLRAQASPVRLVKTYYRKPAGGIGTVRDVLLVLGAADTVLRRKQRDNRNACGEHGVDVAPAAAIEAGVIRDETDALAFQFGEAVGFEHIKTSHG